MSDPFETARAIPEAPRRPLVGSLPDLLAEDTVIESMVALARKHGPLLRLTLPQGRPVLVSSHAHAREIFDDARFRKAVKGPMELLREAVGDGLFTAYGDEPNWKLAHELLMPAFSFQSMRSYYPAMLEIADQLVAKWTDAGDGWVDVCDDMTRLTLDTIGLCGFGARFDSFARPDMHPFVDGMVRMLNAYEKQANTPPAVHAFRFGAKRQLAADIRLLDGTVDAIIRERRASGERADDLLDRMLYARHPETGAALDDVNIRQQAITFLVAGHETTSGMLSFALYGLARHPEVMAKLQAEVDRVLGPDPAVRPTWSQIGELVYTKQTLREALRMWPTAPAIFREPLAATTVGGYRIEADDDFIMLLPMLNRDPEVWGPDADLFDPAHFDKAAMAARPPHAFKGFGSGIRACIGSQFAMVEATLVLAMLAHRFDFEIEPDYELSIVQTLTLKPGNLRLRMRSRTPAQVPRRPEGDVAATAADAPVARVDGARLTVLFGSNMGTAQAFAGRLADAAEARGMAVELAPLDTAVDALPAGACAILCSTYNGLPPDNAKAFVERLVGDAPSGAADAAYAVFGCGHSDWSATFQGVPRRIDARLAEWGATRIVPAGEGDAAEDIEGAFAAWADGLFAALAERLGTAADVDDAPAGAGYAVEIGPPQAANPFVASFGALPMRVLANRELQSWPAGEERRSTRHIELALPEGVEYQAGDHLGVIPINPMGKVEAVCRRFGFEPEATVRVRSLGRRSSHLPTDRAMTLAELLCVYVELQDPASRSEVQALAEHTRCPHTRAELTRLAGEAYRADVLDRRLSVLDLLERFKACALPFHRYLGMLPPLRPRYYSIASSALVDARRCAITVGVLEGPASSGSGRFAGVCSNHLARAPVGATVQAFVRDTGSAFRMPDDARVPMIMIGAGTGLAPFLGFLQARAALAERGLPVGPHALFFGCRHPERDFLYREGLEALVEQGQLALYTAFSRLEDQPKTYVQHRIEAEVDAVWDLLEQGGRVYVCGDAGAMEPGVRAALQGIHQRRTGGDAAASAAWLDGLRGAGRYLTDVWASR